MQNNMRSTDFWRVEHDFQEEELKKFEFLYHEWIFPHTYESLQKVKKFLIVEVDQVFKQDCMQNMLNTFTQ